MQKEIQGSGFPIILLQHDSQVYSAMAINVHHVHVKYLAVLPFSPMIYVTSYMN